MSKLIVEMENPLSCIWTDDNGDSHACPMLSNDDCCKGQSDEANEASETWGDLLKGCPIKGVLPDEHGDLIDRDALLLECMEWFDHSRSVDEEDILNAKAVIAAERSEHGTTAD